MLSKVFCCSMLHSNYVSARTNFHGSLIFEKFGKNFAQCWANPKKLLGSVADIGVPHYNIAYTMELLNSAYRIHSLPHSAFIIRHHYQVMLALLSVSHCDYFGFSPDHNVIQNIVRTLTRFEHLTYYMLKHFGCRWYVKHQTFESE